MVAPAVSVVVPTYRRPDLLDRCLRSLEGQDDVPGGFEAIVVDDGSGDSTGEVLERWGAKDWLSAAIQPANRGPAAARNRGVSMARAPVILFIDDDIFAPPGLVAGHAAFHAGRPGDPPVGVVGHVSWHPDLAVTSFMRWLDSTTLQFGFENMSPGPLPRPWEAFYTCNLSLPRRALEEVGGFDERFPYPAFEDTDLGIRLAERGFVLHYAPALEAWHARAVTLEVFCARMTMVARSGTLLREAQPDLPFDLPLEAHDRPAWKSAAAHLLPLAAAVTRSPRIRDRYYRYRVESAFRDGLLASRA